MKKTTWLALLLFVALGLAASAIAQQKADEKVVCPVSGETMLKSEAKASAVYEGKTYYFCCPGCKEKFLKDPKAYIAKQEAAKEVYTCPMHPDVKSDKPGKCPQCGMNLEKKAADTPAAHAHGGMGMTMGQKETGVCPMMDATGLPGATVISENTKDGITVKITAKDPETVKKLQEMGAKINEMHKNK